MFDYSLTKLLIDGCERRETGTQTPFVANFCGFWSSSNNTKKSKNIRFLVAECCLTISFVFSSEILEALFALAISIFFEASLHIFKMLSLKRLSDSYHNIVVGVNNFFKTFK